MPESREPYEELVRSAAEALIPGSIPADELLIKPVPRSLKAFRVTSRDKKEDHIYRVVSVVDVIGDLGRTIKGVTGQHLAPQSGTLFEQYGVVRRPFIETTLQASTLVHASRRHGHDKAKAKEEVLRFLLDTISGIEDIHSAGRVHGDLRPEKLGITASGDLVIRDIGIKGKNFHSARRYVAPEVDDSRDSSQSQSADIFAFFKIAADLLQPYRSDPEHRDLARLDHQVRWMIDYFHYRAERPPVLELSRFMNNNTHYEGARLDAFLDRIARNKRRLKGKSTFIDLDATTRLLAAHPETRLMLAAPDSQRRLVDWLMLARTTPKPHNKRRYPSALSRRHVEFTRQNLPESIDDRWKNNIHRSMFGLDIDDEHDQRVASLSDPATELQQKRYDSAVAVAEAVRNTLLNEHDFLSTHEVCELLSSESAPLRREEVTVLRQWGMLLAVPDHGRWLYPEFQFHDGAVSPMVLQVHEKLRERIDGASPDPWVELDYWSTERNDLGGEPLQKMVWRENVSREIAHIILSVNA